MDNISGIMVWNISAKVNILHDKIFQNVSECKRILWYIKLVKIQSEKQFSTTGVAE